MNEIKYLGFRMLLLVMDRVFFKSRVLWYLEKCATKIFLHIFAKLFAKFLMMFFKWSSALTLSI